MCTKMECTSNTGAGGGGINADIGLDPDWSGSIDGPSAEI